jgi:hypothetical protein
VQDGWAELALEKKVFRENYWPNWELGIITRSFFEIL